MRSHRSSIEQFHITPTAQVLVTHNRQEWSVDMALYIDSAFLHDILKVVTSVPVAGVTTNPTLMLQAQERGQDLKPQSLLNELLSKIGGTIFIQPGAINEVEMHFQALAYIQAAPDRVIPKIPMT